MILERRLHHNPSLKEAYIQFMRKYVKLGYMSQANTVDTTVFSGRRA